MNEFFTLAVLGTFAGMVAFVSIVTQVIKQFLNIDPKWIALFLSLLAVVFTQIVIPGAITYESFFLGFANWLLVTGAAIGLYEGVHGVTKFVNGK